VTCRNARQTSLVVVVFFCCLRLTGEQNSPDPFFFDPFGRPAVKRVGRTLFGFHLPRQKFAIRKKPQQVCRQQIRRKNFFFGFHLSRQQIGHLKKPQQVRRQQIRRKNFFWFSFVSPTNRPSEKNHNKSAANKFAGRTFFWGFICLAHLASRKNHNKSAANKFAGRKNFVGVWFVSPTT